ncbi:pyrroline-5-carboxylate reductase isoform X2 [Nilaparvata lugens]|uniref:pyrroline-5-carboxylate reductase isoform X2 n=1 Tax=Nilaparvata lugens TaxID=108931 RepID=UPI00193E284C|nr:pyrroline-5-carboxylate reductase isoform X2 [Nilaparvata lugens]XP_039287804.1 pyrroline-5-carboxylate reductase isoform X2 [Nilaparvata lugens]
MSKMSGSCSKQERISQLSSALVLLQEEVASLQQQAGGDNPHNPEKSTIMSEQKISEKIGFLGAGNMAKAIAFGLIESGLLNSPSQILATAPSMSNLEEWKEKGCNVSHRNADLLEQGTTIIFLAVKPQYAREALKTLLEAKEANKQVCLVSIMVGITTGQLRGMISPLRFVLGGMAKYKLSVPGLEDVFIVRTMPNTPLLVGEGCTVICSEIGEPIPSKYLEIVKCILSVNGLCEEVDEKLINPIGALSGSGPAYVYQMIEALSDGGVKLGIPRPLAIKLAAKTLMGGAKMVLETGKHPGQLKDEVCSPGGSTIAGISAMERQGVRFGLISAIEAAYLRSAEISKENEG